MLKLLIMLPGVLVVLTDVKYLRVSFKNKIFCDAPINLLDHQGTLVKFLNHY